MTTWDSTLFLQPSSKEYALVILNQPIHNRKDIFPLLWKNATLRICADGGANRLYDAFKDDPVTLERYIPNAICGDLDSLRDTVRDYYTTRGVPLVQDTDENATDFMKSIAWADKQGKVDVIGFGALGGRFDQTIHSINLLFYYKDDKDRRIWLLSDENMTVLLDRGKHVIKCDRRYEGPTCGVMPIGVAGCHLTTRGLRWNLTDYWCQFGGMVSTSNMLDADEVEIETDAPVVWTVELQSRTGQ